MITHSDPAELPQASTTDHPAEHVLEAFCGRCGHAVDAVCPECGGQVEASGAEGNPKSEIRNPKDGAARSSLSRIEFYRRLVLMVHNARNSKFTLGCYLIATGDGYADGVSMSEFGRRWGVTKACVSQRCELICGYLGIPPSTYMRKRETAAKSRLSNVRPMAGETRRPKAARAREWGQGNRNGEERTQRHD